MTPAPDLVVASERLLLRQWRDDDLAAFAAIEADPLFRRHVGTRLPLTIEEVRAELDEFRAEWRRLGHGRLALEDRASGQLVGLCGVLLFREGTPEASVEIAYGLAPQWWGRGLATEAARAAIGWAFARFPYTSIVGLTHPDNLASQNVLAKLGFEPEGEAMGGYYLARLFRLDRARFEGARAASARRHEVTSLARVNAPTLETARLRLRPWQPDDRAWYVALRADPEVSRFLGDGRPQPDDAASADFEWASSEWARVGLGPWAVEERSTGMRVGYCGLPLWREGTPDEAVEIGYGYARDGWGKGYATEAAAAAMRWAFEVRGLDSLVALTSPENRASQHVLGKLGFTRDGDAEGQHGRGAFFRVTRAAFEASPASEATRATSD